MAVFTITTTNKLPDGSSHYMYVRTAHASVADLVADLRVGPIACEKLRATYDRTANQMIVSASMEYAIGAGLVATIEMQNVAFVASETGSKAA